MFLLQKTNCTMQCAESKVSFIRQVPGSQATRHILQNTFDVSCLKKSVFYAPSALPIAPRCLNQAYFKILHLMFRGSTSHFSLFPPPRLQLVARVPTYRMKPS